MNASLPPKNKNLGQHFLHQKSVIDSIIATVSPDTDAIWEIGPGMGALTSKLSLLNKKLILFEKDSRFFDHLNQFSQNLIKGDFLKVDLEQIAKDLHPEMESKKNFKLTVISNLPYNVSSQIFIKLLKFNHIHEMTLMYQKEVGEKTISHELDESNLSSLSILSSLFFDAKKLLIVHPAAFTPPPKVQSIVIHYQKKEKSLIPLSDFIQMEKLLRLLYGQPRKQLAHLVKTSEQSRLAEYFSKHQLLQARPANLTLNHILEIFKIYYTKDFN